MTMITEFNQIDNTTEEGKLLLAAISIIWIERKNITPNEIIKELYVIKQINAK